MKKIAIAGISALMMTQGHAQSLEERVEALEYQSYENFFKVRGSLEMRFDFVSRDNKDTYTTVSDPGKFAEAVVAVAALANVNGTTAQGLVAGTACGADISGTGVIREDCNTVDEGKDNSRVGRVFLNLDMESNPSDKLSFYGRLSMAKNLSVISSTGGNPDDAAFSDLSAGATASDSSIWVERAFANYQVNDDLTFTFGRLPTIDGAPQHHHTDEPMAGNYPILAFSGIFDGMALTQNFGKHTARVVYSPFSSVNFNDGISQIQDPNGDKISRMEDAYALMYEYSNADFDFARKVNVIAMHNMVGNMPILGTDLKLGIQRTSIYAEALDIANSGFTLAVHGMSSITESEGAISSALGVEGWLTDEQDDKTTGTAYGILGKYNFRNGFMKGSSIGAEYFHGDKGAFLYDSANVDPVSMYTTFGDAYRVFYTKNFEGGLKWNVQYMNQQQDYTYEYVGLIGDLQEIDRNTSFISTSFIANF